MLLQIYRMRCNSIQTKRMFLQLLLAYSLPYLVNTYTFSSPGKSSLTYSVKWDLTPQKEMFPSSGKVATTPISSKYILPDLKVHFRFKTWQTETLLMECYVNRVLDRHSQRDSVGDDDIPKGNSEENILPSPTDERSIRLVLYKGVLVVKAGHRADGMAETSYDEDYDENGDDMDIYENNKYDIGDNDAIGLDGLYSEEHLPSQEALNNNSWQNIIIIMNRTRNYILVKVNDHGTVSLPLPEQLQKIWDEPLELTLKFGGSDDIPYEGCINDIRFQSMDDKIVHSDENEISVSPGCIDLCMLPNQCWNHGRCLNLYTNFLCDCMDTGHEGKYCERYGLDTITLQGSEWIIFRTFKAPQEVLYGGRLRVAFQFKTHAREGVLVYGSKDIPHYSHLALYLKDGMLHFSVVDGNPQLYSELYTFIGSNLNDDRWHNVTLTFAGHEVLLVLDSEPEKMASDEKVELFQLPSVIYYGGLKTTGETRGLKTGMGFVGCFRGLYINHLSVLEQLPSRRSGTIENSYIDMVSYNSMNSADMIMGCVDSSASSLQFTHDGSFTSVPCVAAGKILDISLQFKTNKANCLLLYNVLTRGGKEHGYLQVSLLDGDLVLKIQADHKEINSVIMVGNFNDNSWHTLSLLFHQASLAVTMDGVKKYENAQMNLTYSGNCFLAFSPVSPRYGGFVGCLKNIFIQQKFVNPVTILHSDLTVGVTLGSCNLVDQCQSVLSRSLCQHKSQCVSEWSDIICDCRHTHHEGRYCQFEKLPSSCDELLHSGGVTTLGVYSIEPGREVGFILTMKVSCTTAHNSNKEKVGVTVVEHNLKAGSTLRKQGWSDLQKVISYRTVSNIVLRNLIQVSDYCEQVIEFSCQHSPLRFGEMTWLGSDGMNVDISIPTSNCDSGRYEPFSKRGTHKIVIDRVVITDRVELPVTDIYVRQTAGQTNVTLGPLVCKGSVSRRSENTVTFTSDHSYLYIPTSWKGGEVKIEFRTTRNKATLLYQKEGKLKIILAAGNVLQFHLPVSVSPYNIVTRSKLNDTKWHSVSMETQNGELRVVVDGQTTFLKVQHDVENHKVTEQGDTHGLYIGGSPVQTNKEGFTGCIRGLVVDGQLQHLSQLIEHGDYSILPGCVSQCDSSPCQNGGKCVEDWTHYHCDCVNKLAHLGKNCQIDINKDIIQFTKDRGSLKLPLSRSVSLVNITLVFSFRTRQKQTELMYASDKSSNDLTVSVHNHTTVQATLGGTRQASVHICSPGFSDGRWKQVGLKVQTDIISLQVGDQMETSLLSKKTKMSVVHSNEYTPAMLQIGRLSDNKQSVLPSDKSLFTGCFRGLKINDFVVNLQKQSRYVLGVNPDCSDPCYNTKHKCVNGGECVSNHDRDTYTCNCVRTGHAGSLCDKEVGVHFEGKTCIIQWLSADNTGSLYTQVTFHFASDTRNNQKMMLLQVLGKPGSLFRLCIYLTETCTLVTNYTVNSTTAVVVESSLSMCDGVSHLVQVTRRQQHITFKVDEEETIHKLFPLPCSVMDSPSMVVVGGTLRPGYPAIKGCHNFTGDMSNAFVESDQLSIVSRPLDIASGSVRSAEEQVTVYGNIIPASHSLVEHITNTAASALPVTLVVDQGDLPPIQPANAKTVKLHTQAAVPINSGSMDLGIIIGICVGVLIVIAIIIAIIWYRYCRKKQQQWSPETVNKDEEEGLLTDGATSPSSSPSKGAVTGTPGDKTDSPTDVSNHPEVTFRPKGVKNGAAPSGEKKKSQLPFDEDNEATPMLLSMQHHITDDTVELTAFQAQLENMPMIDDGDDESSLEDIPAVPLKPQEKAYLDKDTEVPSVQPNNQPTDDVDDSKEIFPPNSENQTQVNGEQESQPEDTASEHSAELETKSENTSNNEDPGKLPDPRALQVKLRKHRGISPDRAVLTESMVLDMLETKDEAGEAVAPGANTSFSSLPEDSQPILDLEVQADVHHRTISFDGVGDEHSDKYTVANGDMNCRDSSQNDSAYFQSSNSVNTEGSHKSLPVIHENNGNNNKAYYSNGECVNGFDNNGSENHNGIQNGHVDGSHLNDKNDDVVSFITKNGDVPKSNGPSVVVDSSLNEITEDPR